MRQGYSVHISRVSIHGPSAECKCEAYQPKKAFKKLNFASISGSEYSISVRKGQLIVFYTVIRFDSTSAKLDICTVVGLNGTLVHLKIKCVQSRVNVNILASTSVPFRPTTVQMPNLALTRHETDNSVV